MRFKALLISNTPSIFDDFFSRASANFEYQSCSPRHDDITCHLRYFKPDAIIYGMRHDNTKDHLVFDALRRQIATERIALAVYGELDDCLKFTEDITDLADMTFTRPINTSSIEEQLNRTVQSKQVLKDAFAEPSNSTEEVPGIDSIPYNAGRKHILVVDDDARMLKLIKTYLTEQYDVATAINGKVALKFLENRKTDLILLDYEMPEEDGAQVLEKLRFNPETASLPVIFLTGVSDKDAIRKVLSLNPQGYLLKPVSRVKLFSSIKGVLG